MKLYGITYGDKTTEFIPYHNDRPQKAWRFEYAPMIDILDNMLEESTPGEWIGIFSWKFTNKTGLSLTDLQRIRDQVNISEDAHTYQVINLSPTFTYPIAREYRTFMDWSEAGHPGITRFIQMCCDATGMTYIARPAHVVYANQFIARKSIYVDYINTVIKPSLDLLEGDLWEQVNKPAGYTAGLLPDRLKEQTGLDFYNYIPFILERLMMQYVANRKIKTIDIL